MLITCTKEDVVFASVYLSSELIKMLWVSFCKIVGRSRPDKRQSINKCGMNPHFPKIATHPLTETKYTVSRITSDIAK